MNKIILVTGGEGRFCKKLEKSEKLSANSVKSKKS